MHGTMNIKFNDETVTFDNSANAPKMKSGWSNDVFHRTGLTVW